MSVQAPPRRSSWLARRVGPEREGGQAFLDGVRAIAVLMVVVFHCWGIMGSHAAAIGPVDLTWAPAAMGLGVHVFFLLSAFLLAQPWFRAELSGRPRPRIGRFWTRRLVRIVPAYYVSIVVVLAVFMPLGRIPREAVSGALGLRNLGGQALFLQGIYPVASSNLDGMNGVYWTLTVEMSLYLLLPLAVWLFMGRRWRWALPAAFLVTVGWTWAVLNSMGPLVTVMTRSVEKVGPTLAVPTDTSHARQLLHASVMGYLFTFALGIALARLAVVVERRGTRPRTVFFAAGAGAGPGAPVPWWLRRWVGRTVFVVGLAVVIATMYGAVQISRATPGTQVTYYLQVLPASLGLAAMFYGVAFAGVGRRVLEWSPLRFVGWISYGIYLFHLVALRLIHENTDLRLLPAHWEFAPLLAAVLLSSGVVATLSWAIVERPLLVARNRGFSHRMSRPGRRAVAVVGSAVAAMVLVVVSVSPMAATAGTANGLFAGPVDGAYVNPMSGAATPAQAVARNLIYPQEADFLGDCPVAPGSAVLLVGPEWSVSASAFECADADEAAHVVDRLLRWEPTVGFGRLEHPRVEDGGVFYHKSNPESTDRPAVFHVRVQRDKWVVGFAVQAASPEAGRIAVKALLAAVQTPS